jgi:hypothetical protein
MPPWRMPRYVRNYFLILLFNKTVVAWQVERTSRCPIPVPALLPVCWEEGDWLSCQQHAPSGLAVDGFVSSAVTSRREMPSWRMPRYVHTSSLLWWTVVEGSLSNETTNLLPSCLCGGEGLVRVEWAGGWSGWGVPRLG